MLDSTEIRRRLPHRYPLLLVDRLLECGPDRALGQKHVTANEPYFRGHFPVAPVMPGVLVMESLFQLVWLGWGEEAGFHLCGVRRLKFRRSVVPGDLLELEAQALGVEEEKLRFRCFARVDGKVAVEGELHVRRRPPKSIQQSLESQREPVRA